MKPDPKNPNDPAYSIKFVHNMPPLEAYKLKVEPMDRVSTVANTQNRFFFYGWNNLTDFEKKGIEDIKAHLKKNFN